jgi:type II secretory pathway pseudopilin PulG
MTFRPPATVFTVISHRTPVAPLGTSAFSLVEVVVAVGIFAVGIVAVLGLFAPVVQSARASSESEAAAGVVDLLASRLRVQSIAAVADCLKSPAQFEQDASRSDYDPVADSRVFYASLAGDKIGLGDDPVWNGRDRDKFFEIVLIRNEALSPVDNDGAAAWLAFNVRVRWPAFLPLGNGGAVQIGAGSNAAVRFDHGQKQALLFSGSVRR